MDEDGNNQDKKSEKFWEIRVQGSTHTVRYGKKGSDGQTRSKEHASAAEARTAAGKLIEQKAKKREEVQERIQTLAVERQDYIQKERAKMADSDEKGLDEVIQEGLQAQAEDKGFTFTTSK